MNTHRVLNVFAPALNHWLLDGGILFELLCPQIRTPIRVSPLAYSPCADEQCTVMKPQCNVTVAAASRLLVNPLLNFRLQTFGLDRMILHKSLLHFLPVLPSLDRMPERTESETKNPRP